MIWVLLLAAVIATVPLVVEARRKPMNDAARQIAPGDFANLSQGVTHFRWTGPEGGPVVVCIHGLTTPGFVWTSTAEGLAAEGFRVLRYDLYGRGFSDRPGGHQDSAFFLRQLQDLLEDQRVEEDITLIGYSMGGVIAAAFAADQPAMIRQMVLLAPAGMLPVAQNLRAMIRTPGLGLWLMLLRYPATLRRGLRAEAHLPTTVPGITALQAAELDYRGFLPAVHSSLRHMLTDPLQDAHKKVRREGIPVLAIWGAEDTVIPLRAMEVLRAWNADAEQHVIEGAGHGLTYTHTDAVLARMIAFTRNGA